MFVPINSREGYLLCDNPPCVASSTIFPADLGDELPEGWVESQRFRPGPGKMGHLCPVHAGLRIACVSMDDATIRSLFRELGELKFGTPPEHLSVTPDALAARGLDPDDAARWVEAHGGYVDRSEHRRTGLAPDYGKLDVFVRLIVPEAALRD